MSASEFGTYLRQLRKAKGLTLDELGELCNYSNPYLSQIENGKGRLSKQHLSNVENGRRLPPTDLLRSLSQALGVTYIGMLIKAGHVTEEEVLFYRKEHGINEE